MIFLMHGDPWSHRPPKRHTLRDAGLTLASVIAALIMLPAICLDVLIRALFPTSGREY